MRSGLAVGGDGGEDGSGVPAGGGQGGAGAGGEVLDEGPAGQGLGVGDLRSQHACGFPGQTGGEIGTFVAGQLAPQAREDQADGFVGSLTGGVGAFVADLLQHLLVRRRVRLPVLKRFAHVGDHCGACLSWESWCRCAAPRYGSGGPGAAEEEVVADGELEQDLPQQVIADGVGDGGQHGADVPGRGLLGGTLDPGGGRPDEPLRG